MASTKVTAWIPKPKFIVMVAVALVAIGFVLKAGAGNQYVQKIKAYMGLNV